MKNPCHDIRCTVIPLQVQSDFEQQGPVLREAVAASKAARFKDDSTSLTKKESKLVSILAFDESWTDGFRSIMIKYWTTNDEKLDTRTGLTRKKNETLWQEFSQSPTSHLNAADLKGREARPTATIKRMRNRPMLVQRIGLPTANCPHLR